MFLKKLNILWRGKRAQPPKEPYAFIDLRKVTKFYENPSGGFLALKDITMQIHAGEFVAIAGKSGSGKSTLLNMITGVDRPTSGEIIIDGKAIHKFNETRLTIWRGNAVGIIFQFFQLLPTMTILENIILPMDFCGYSRPWSRRERALTLLKAVDLAEQRNRLPSHVSGGQQQRAAIARALANDPPIIVADEPTGNLDSASAEAVFLLLERLTTQGKTVILVTHDMDLARRCHRILCIADGQVISDQINTTKGSSGDDGSLPASPQEEVPGAAQLILETDPALSPYLAGPDEI